MTPAKKLTLDGMSDAAFDNWKKQNLDRETLEGLSLIAIRNSLDLSLSDSTQFSVSCDEQHAHSYSCLKFKSRHAAVYLRLIEEIERYGGVLLELGRRIDAARGGRLY
ncbi:MAG: hypothetical protein AABX50_01310 [Nanoarchaeota archaeon]